MSHELPVELPEKLANNIFMKFMMLNEELVDLFENVASSESDSSVMKRGVLTGRPSDIDSYKNILSKYSRENGFVQVGKREPDVMRFSHSKKDVSIEVVVSPSW